MNVSGKTSQIWKAVKMRNHVLIELSFSANLIYVNICTLKEHEYILQFLFRLLSNLASAFYLEEKKNHIWSYIFSLSYIFSQFEQVVGELRAIVKWTKSLIGSVFNQIPSVKMCAIALL